MNNPECGRARSRIKCKLTFPKDNLVVPDGELVIIHNERYERTAKDSSGKFLHMTINHPGRKFYCISESCLSFRCPYFWRGMLMVKNAAKHRLSWAHKLFHSKKLHFN